jgi:hypothetical protein
MKFKKANGLGELLLSLEFPFYIKTWRVWVFSCFVISKVSNALSKYAGSYRIHHGSVRILWECRRLTCALVFSCHYLKALGRNPIFQSVMASH